jgi:hypothetical protein
MKTALSLTLLSIILATNHSAFGSQVATQTVKVVKAKDSNGKDINIVNVYCDNKLYLAIKREEKNNQIDYIARDCFTQKTLTYIFSPTAKVGYSITQGEDGFQCISPTDEHRMLLTIFESAIAPKASKLTVTSSSTSSQSSSTATSAQAPVTAASTQAASAQAQSSSTTSSLIAKVASLIWKS